MNPNTGPHLAMHRKALGVGPNPKVVEWLRGLEAYFVEQMEVTESPGDRETLEVHLRLVRDCIEAEQERGK